MVADLKMLLKLPTFWSRSWANCETYKLSAALMTIPRDTLHQLSSIVVASKMAMSSSVASVGGSEGSDITANWTQLLNLLILLKITKGWLQSPLAREKGRDLRMIPVCSLLHGGIGGIGIRWVQ